MSDLEKRLAALSPEKRELLLRRSARKTPEKVAARPAANAADENEPAPLSFAQQRLWFLEQLEGRRAAYHIGTALRLHGPLDALALRRAWEAVVARHAILRTVFFDDHGTPRQRVRPDLHPPLVETDLRNLPLERREAEAHRLAVEELDAPFDLNHGPLLRARLLRMSDDEHVLVVAVHHLISDGWSVNVFFSDWSACYIAETTGRPPVLEPLPLQYAAFARHQRERAQNNSAERSMEYWKKQLADAPELLALPGDRPRPPAQSFKGGMLSFVVEPGLTRRLKELGRSANAGLFMTLTAGFAAFLSRWSGKDDLVIGTPIAGRLSRELEPLLGFFANTLALRVDLSGRPTFRELLAQVRQTALDAYDHQETPFERLVEALQPERSFSHAPLFQVMFALQNAPNAPFAPPGLVVTRFDVEYRRAPFDLLAVAAETEAGLEFTWEYAEDLFDGSTMRRLRDCFLALMENLAARPDQPADAAAWLNPDDRTALIRKRTCTNVIEPKHHRAHHWFEAQARRNPQQIALKFHGQTLTYAELNAAADRVAGTLHKHGVSPGRVVGIMLPRSLEHVIAILAVVKAGGICLPLDLTHPPARRREILDDAGPVLLLTDRAVEALDLPSPLLPVVNLHETMVAPAVERTAEEQSGKTDAPMYVLYTSGSTGRPKGVVMGQAAFANLIDWHLRDERLRRGARTVQFSALTFDVSFQEIFSTLASGGTLVVVDEAIRRDPTELLRVMQEERIERIFLPFAALLPLARAAEDGQVRLESLLDVVTAGEQLLTPPPLVALFSRLPKARLHNHYGPTETHVATACILPDGPGSWSRRPSIGRPIQNCQAYVLDRNLEPQPDGIPGELYLAGFCLADGYLNRKDLTHERFVVDPFSSEPRARMYKTGDLARFLPDGSLEFLGRADQQVKIRGFRVEPGEIEAALAEHPEVREAVVKAIEDPTGGRRLAAYLTTRRAVRSAALREYLRERLPDYMIPACFVILPEFPLTHGGKVNRRALPPPDPENAAEKPLGIKTELSPASEILKGLWQELLQVRAVGPEDDFFALGGHSLLAVQLVSRICDAFGVQLPVRAVFEAPTLRAMAEKVEGAGQIDAEVLEPLRPLSRPESLPLSFAQERLWTACRLDESGIAYNMPAALRLQGPLNVAALAEAFRAVSKRHEILRTGFIERLGQPTAVIENDVVVELRVDDPALPSGKERADYWRDATSAEAGRAFDLTRPPLMRARLVGTSKNDHLLLLTMHHLISDGWSIGVLARELSAFYQAFIEGRSPALSPLSVQYADYALWQKKWLSPKVLQRQLNRWTDEFSAADFSTGRLGDRPHSSGQACRGAAMPVRFNADLARQLNLVARANGATLYMVLLAAWAVLTTKISGRAEGFFGVPAAGRTRRELEALIGFFVNLLPVRLKPDGARPFSEFLAQVRRKTLEAYGRQEVPFEEIVKRMRASGLSATTPPVQSVVVLQNTPARAMRLEGVEITSVEIGIPSAKFELLLSLDESPSGLSGYLEYNADLFLPKTCSTLASGFQDICLAIAANPGCTPDSLMEGLFRSDALAVEENGDEQFSFPE